MLPLIPQIIIAFITGALSGLVFLYLIVATAYGLAGIFNKLEGIEWIFFIVLSAVALAAYFLLGSFIAGFVAGLGNSPKLATILYVAAALLAIVAYLIYLYIFKVRDRDTML